MNRTTRVAFLSEHASPLARLGSTDAGGQNVYIDELSRQLGQIGYSIDIFTRGEHPALHQVVSWAPKVRVIELPAGPPGPLSKDEIWPYMPAFRQALLRFMLTDGARYDILHGNFWMSGWAACRLRRRLNIPLVQIFHATGKTKRRHQGEADTSPDERIAAELEIVAQADRLIAQCPSEQDELIDDYGADLSRVALIPSAVNTERFRPISQEVARRQIDLGDTTPTVVYIGRMLPRKDVRNLLRAVAILTHRYGLAPRLLIVGGETSEPDRVVTPEIGVLQDLAIDLGIAGQVRFYGKRQPETLHAYYCAGDVAVTTPWYEPFGLTPLEAQACSRPVIGSAVGGIPFTIKDGETGLLVPPQDPEALAAALYQLLSNPGQREAMGAAARARVLAEFTWSVVAQRTARLYENLLAARVQPTTQPKTDRARQL